VKVKRAVTVLGIMVCGVPGVALAASGVPPRAAVRALVCQRALDPPARAVSVTAVMRPLAGTARLAVNFSLLEKAAGVPTWSPLAGPGLGVWISPADPTLGQRPGDVWYVNHPVADLAAPARYRFSVRFRWIGAHDRVIGAATRTSGVCVQPELRPDLVVNSVAITPDPSNAKLDTYVAVIGDTGAGGAGPFAVELSDQGSATDRTVQHLAGHATRKLGFTGPACNPHDPPTVTVDPTDQVDVFSRSQASLTVPCPPAGSSA
jgi:hypothetical protein